MTPFFPDPSKNILSSLEDLPQTKDMEKKNIRHLDLTTFDQLITLNNASDAALCFILVHHNICLTTGYP